MNERHTAWLLAIVLLAQLALLSGQVPVTDRRGSLLERFALWVVTPFAWVTDSGLASVQGAGQGLKTRRGLRQANAELHQEVASLRREVARLQGVERELERLGEANRYVLATGGTLGLARVVYIDSSTWLRSIIIHAGDQPVDKNQPVLTAEGLVGRVIAPAGSHARVQLVIDSAASVGVVVERTGQQAVVTGTGSSSTLELSHLSALADVIVGDRIVTAGNDGVYAPGIPLGEVTSVQDDSDPLFLEVKLRPFVDFDRLELVYLLASQGLPSELRQDGNAGG